MFVYQNPVPDMDDEPQSRSVQLVFTFEQPVTRDEAAENLNEWFKRNTLTGDMIQLRGPVGMRDTQRQPCLGANDSDPDGRGPR